MGLNGPHPSGLPHNGFPSLTEALRYELEKLYAMVGFTLAVLLLRRGA
jgi:hypothetical protein